MPTPQKFARGDKMGRGPYEKSGIIEDGGLLPHKTKEERFDISFPTEDTTNEKGRVIEREILEKKLNINVKLWYLPFGNKRTTPYVWQDVDKVVTID